MIRFQCPNCNTVLQIGKEYAGQPVLCSSCNTQLIVPQIQVPEPTLDKADRNVIICICGQCKSTFKVPAASAGRQVPCPKCGHSAQIPEQEQVITDSNTLKFACPACWQYYCVLAKYAGKKFKCLICKQPCVIPQPASPPQDLVLLDEEQAPPPPPEPQAQAGQELSFKLLAEEEPESSPYQLELEQRVSPGPPPPPEAPAPRTAPRPQKTREKSSGFSFKLAAGIIAGIIGFVAGFAVVYMLVKATRSPEVQSEQVQTPEESGAEEQTPTEPQARTDKPISVTKQTPAESRSQSASQAGPPAFQKEEILEFATGTAQYLNPRANAPWDYPDLKYRFQPELTVSDADMEALKKAMDVSLFDEINSTIETARMEIGASWYLVRTSIVVGSAVKREMFMAIFEIEEESEEGYTETVCWVFSLTIWDEKGTVLASVGPQNPDELIAQMDPLVDEHGTGITVEQADQLTGLAQNMGALFCPILIGFFIFAIIMIVSMWTVYEKAGEPGWAVLIPVYNLVVLARVGGRPEWMGLVCFLSPLIPFIGGLINLYLTVYITIGVAETFGKGILFALGLFFLPFIFYPILAITGDTFTD